MNPTPNPSAVESLEPLTLGGLRQWVLIRGQDRSRPVLLWLHGGPGSPTLPLAHRYDAALLPHFVVVHWDQRGAGKSFDPALSPGDLVVEKFVADALELTALLRQRFGAEKIYLVGHSWGSVLGALAVQRRPEWFRAFVGVGQSVHIPQAQAVAYDLLLRSARAASNADAVRELTSVGKPPWNGLEPLQVFGKWAFGLGGVMRGLSPDQLNQTVAASPHYTPQDLERWQQGQAFSAQALLEPVTRINLLESVPELGVPVYLFTGRHDLNSPGVLAERWLGGLKAPQKRLVWFEGSAHFPMWEEAEKFDREMLKVLEETAPR